MEHLTPAVDLLRETGEVRSAAVALVRLARARHGVSAEPREVDDIYRAAISLLDGDAPSPELLSVLTEWGRRLIERNQRDAGVETFERAIAISRDMGGPSRHLPCACAARSEPSQATRGTSTTTGARWPRPKIRASASIARVCG